MQRKMIPDFVVVSFVSLVSLVPLVSFVSHVSKEKPNATDAPLSQEKKTREQRLHR